MVSMELDDSGAKRKLKQVRATVKFITNAHADMANFFVQRLVDEITAGQYVKVHSSNFRRSWDAMPIDPVTSIITSDLAIAPYAPFVVAWSARKYGRSVLAITVELFGREAERSLQREWTTLVESINEGRRYTYRNPFR